MAGNCSLKRKVYSQILERVIRNEFPLEEFLVEGRLAKMFGVSRAPVREALVELCNEKILRNIPRAGYQIVQPSSKELRDAFQLRLILETEGMRLACDRLNGESKARLQALQKELQQVENCKDVGLEEWMSSGSRLHLAIAELSGNQLLCEKIQEVLNLIRRATAQIYLDREYPPRQEPRLHENILEAMLSGEKEQAVELLRKDINTLREVLREV